VFRLNKTAIVAALIFGLMRAAESEPNVADDDDTAVQLVAEATPTLPPLPPPDPRSGPGTKVEKSLTLNFKDADIRSFISAVSELTKRNFVIDPRVQGKVTVVSAAPTDPDDLYQVFLSILKVHGFTAVAKDGMTTIIPEMLAKQDDTPTISPGSMRKGEDVVTGVIPVHFVSAAELVPVLRPLLPQDSHMAATAGTNVLVIADTASNVERMLQIVSKLDVDNTAGVDVVHLQNAVATEIVTILDGLVTKTQGAAPPAAGSVTAFAADDRTNSVLVAGTPQSKLRYRTIIANLDGPQSENNVIRVVPLRYANARDISDTLQEAATGQASAPRSESRGLSKQDSAQSLGAAALTNNRPQTGGGGGGSPGAQNAGALGVVRITADEITNSLIVQGPPRDVKKVMAVITQIDVRRAQVLVEGIIAEVSSSKTDELGVQWKTSLPNTGVLGATNFAGKASGAIDSPFAASDAGQFLGGLTLGYFAGGDLRTLVRVLSGDNATNVLSTPSLMTLDNAEAEIVVGQNVPFVTGQFTNNATTPDNPFQTIQRQDVGIKLRVKPQINEGNTVTMDIEQEVSSVDESTRGADIITNKRSIKTSVQVDNGSIVVLGGLIGDDARANRDKIPVLGDIPVLGNLFKNARRSSSKTNLMVFLRPQIVRDRAGAASLSRERYEDIRAKQQQQNGDRTELLLPQRGAVLPEGILE